MTGAQRERLFSNIARHMKAGNTPEGIQLRQICHFFRADPGYGQGVAQALGIELRENLLQEIMPMSAAAIAAR
jgi:catalase